MTHFNFVEAFELFHDEFIHNCFIEQFGILYFIYLFLSFPRRILWIQRIDALVASHQLPLPFFLIIATIGCTLFLTFLPLIFLSLLKIENVYCIH